jgi:hypothetical protein
MARESEEVSRREMSVWQFRLLGCRCKDEPHQGLYAAALGQRILNLGDDRAYIQASPLRSKPPRRSTPLRFWGEQTAQNARYGLVSSTIDKR